MPIASPRKSILRATPLTDYPARLGSDVANAGSFSRRPRAGDLRDARHDYVGDSLSRPIEIAINSDAVWHAPRFEPREAPIVRVVVPFFASRNSSTRPPGDDPA